LIPVNGRNPEILMKIRTEEWLQLAHLASPGDDTSK
jgi:hypothetical protein